MAKIGKSSWSRAIVSWFVALVLSGYAGADEPDGVRIPKEGQPTENFYNAAGSGVKVIANAVPTDITRDEWLTYSLTIVNLLNAPDVQKPSLKAIPGFNSFQIDESPELDAKADPTLRDRRVFIYRLRPHSESTTLIPEIKFHFFDPQRVVPRGQPQKRFGNTYSNAVTIRIKALSEPPPAQSIPLDIPSFASELVTGEKVLATPSRNPPVWVWVIAMFLSPLLAVGWVIVWRRLYPDAAKLALLRRNHAVRVALATIAKSKSLPSNRRADAIASAILTYLRERFELPPGVFTPLEVAAYLRSSGCPSQRIGMVESLLRDCDNSRFAPVHEQSEIAMDAERLVIALEEPA